MHCVQPYLPGQTPPGLRSYRSKDLEEKRGDGRGERKPSDRIYDYATYNDLGDPDSDAAKARPVLGGSAQFPYPRRCRTGRPMSAKDPSTETRSGDNYVPRDEAFSEVKNLQFSVTTLRSVLHAAVPAVQSTLIDPNLAFPSFFVIDKLFEDGVELPKADQLGFLRSVVPRLLQLLRDGPGDQVLLFDRPANVQSTYISLYSLFFFGFVHSAQKSCIYLKFRKFYNRRDLNSCIGLGNAEDKFAWLRDEEFARETLAGMNPYAIELVRVSPSPCPI